MTDEEVLSLLNKRKKGTSKYFTIILTFAILLIGVLASFKNSLIEMEKFVMFLSEFKLILSTLIGSVGIGLAVKSYKGKNE